MRTLLLAAVLSVPSTRVCAQAQIPVRTTTLLVATDSGVLRNVTDVRHLQDGNNVLVNDTLGRKVLLLDETFKKITVVVANDGSTTKQYGRGGARLLPSGPTLSMFLGASMQSLAVISPSGKIERSANIPPAADVVAFANPIFGTPYISASGGFMFRGGRPARAGVADSAPILSVGANGRIADTLLLLALPTFKTGALKADGQGSGNTLTAADEWTVVYDGTLAVIRQRDYHVTWFGNDRASATPKMPIEWRKMPVETKAQIADSLRALGASAQAADVPDYFPAIRPGETRADLDNNLWTLPYSSTIEAGHVYDVVNRQGLILERVQIPPGRLIVGFGRRGTVYLKQIVGPNDTRLERVRVNR